MARPDPGTPALADRLRAIVGGDHVLTDDASRTLYSQDIYARGERILAAVRPASTDELAAVVAAVTAAGHAAIPRGGGMSYSGGYLAIEPDSVLIDLRRMNRVLEVNPEDMTVTVEAGCTWQALHESLAGTGLRTPFWGTLSGLHATVGGGLSQNGIFWGSGRYGTAVESVLSLCVVLANGTIVHTGSAARDGGRPFFRHYGPDLTGLFCCDTGALGFKATATLRLMPALTAHRFASFDFAGYEALIGAMSELARRELPMECFAFDPYLQRQRLQRESLLKDVKALGNLIKSSGSVAKAVAEGARVAMAGRGYMKDVQWSLHLVFEERDDHAAERALAEAREVCGGRGGREIENSIPKLLRANPFTPLNNVAGPRGERWAPIHGIVAHSQAAAAMAAVRTAVDAHAESIERHGIGVGYLFATIATNGFVIEPVFFWPDALRELHAATIEPGVYEKLPGFAADPAAREAVATLRAALVAALRAHGGVHMQIGKAYGFADDHGAAARALLEAIKAAVDPQRRVNPGSLDLR